MKNCFFLVILVCSCFYTGCSVKQHKNDIDYIKVISFGDADTVSLYNKGIGLDVFAYYEPEKDSFLYINRGRFDTSQNRAFTAKLQGTAYRDSLVNIVTILQKRKPGNIVDTTFHYCVDPIYIEYSINNKINYHYFIQNDDTINNFCKLLFNFSTRPLKKEVFKNSFSTIETHAVDAMKKLGEYEKKEEPYMPVSCDDGINKEKIYGSWRQVHDGFNHKNTFTKATFTKNGTYFFENIREGIAHKKAVILEFHIPPGDRVFVVTTKGQKSRTPILKLTDSCFVVKPGNHVLKFNRL